MKLKVCIVLNIKFVSVKDSLCITCRISNRGRSSTIAEALQSAAQQYGVEVLLGAKAVAVELISAGIDTENPSAFASSGSSTTSTGGSGGGGNTGVAGTVNTGGGGGGAYNGTGGAGGSGIIVISIPIANYPGNANVVGTYTYANTGTAIVLGFTANTVYTA
jgi:hypothetical protein